MKIDENKEWTESGLKTETEYVLSQKEWDELQARSKELEAFTKLVIEELDAAALTRAVTVCPPPFHRVCLRS